MLARLRYEALILRDSYHLGATLIHRELERRYPKAKFSQRTVSNWIARPAADVPPPPAEPWKKWEPSLWQQDAGYLLRLDLITKTMNQRPLNETEALWATRLEVALGSLNMFAQWALIDEYAHRNTHSTKPVTDDLDLIVATRPWLDDGELFRAAAETRVIEAGYAASIRALRLPASECGPIWDLLPQIAPTTANSSVVITPRIVANLIGSLPTDAVAIHLVFEMGIALHQGINITGRSDHSVSTRTEGDPGDVTDESRSAFTAAQTGITWQQRLIKLWQQLGSRSSHRPSADEDHQEDQNV
jgi:hypothetical protein